MKNAIKNKIFDFAYHEALNDATMQQAYSGNKNKIENNIDAKNLVKKYIDSILCGEDIDFYNIANQLLEQIGDNDFTFGNAQKLINMTAKYICISAYSDEKAAKNICKFHCPMDSKMISKVVATYRDAIKQDVSADKQILKLTDKSESWSSVRWSKIKENNGIHSIDTYKKYQKMVKYLSENTCFDSESGKQIKMSPIEYDFWIWNP